MSATDKMCNFDAKKTEGPKWQNHGGRKVIGNNLARLNSLIPHPSLVWEKDHEELAIKNAVRD